MGIRARPLLMMTTKVEMPRWENDHLPEQCIQAVFALDHRSFAAYNACLARYNVSFYKEKNMRVSYESMHAEAFLTSLVNTRKGGRSYVGEFELANYSNHANDMYFFIGLHPILSNKTDVVLMDSYYPQMIKNFLHGKAPDKDWKSQKWNGRNYFRITFNVSANGTLLDWPHNVDGFQDVAGLDFWLRELAEVERNATKKAKGKGEENELWKYVFGGSSEEERKVNDLLDKKLRENDEDRLMNNREEDEIANANGQNANKRPAALSLPFRSFMAAVPPPLKMLGSPQFDQFGDTEVDEDDGEDGESGEREKQLNTTTSTTTPITTSAIPLEQVSSPFSDNDSVPSTSTTTTDYPLETYAAELGKVWSAFWLTLTVTILLALAVVVMSATKMIYRHKNQRGYSYNTDDSGFFTEKSRIVTANDANGMRYM